MQPDYDRKLKTIKTEVWVQDLHFLIFRLLILEKQSCKLYSLQMDLQPLISGICMKIWANRNFVQPCLSKFDLLHVTIYQEF